MPKPMVCCGFNGCTKNARVRAQGEWPTCDGHYAMTVTKKKGNPSKNAANYSSNHSLALRLKAMREAAKKRKKISNPSVAKLIGRPVVVGGLTGKVTSASTHYKQPRFTIRREDGSTNVLNLAAAEDAIQRFKTLEAKFAASDAVSAKELSEITAGVSVEELARNQASYGLVNAKPVRFKESSTTKVSNPTPRRIVFGLGTPPKLFFSLDRYLKAATKAADASGGNGSG